MPYRMLFVWLAGAALALPAAAQEAPGEPLSPGKALLADTMAYAASLDALRFEFSADLRINDPADPFDETVRGTIALLGDDYLYFETLSEAGDQTYYADGETVTGYLAAENAYIQMPMQSSRQAVMRGVGGDVEQVGYFFLGAILHNDAMLLRECDSAEVAELDDGRVRLDLTMKRFDARVWLSGMDKPFVERFYLDLTRALTAEVEDVGGAFVELDMRLSEIDRAADLDEAVFAFTPPEGAEEIRPTQQTARRGPQALVGEPAPAVKLDTLDGGTLDTAALQGEKVVVLDFWATWCGPCRVALPVIAETAGAFADQDVVFYAVNIRESPEQVRGFLEQMELDVPVAMDRQGSAQADYMATSIPTTVVIGKDGIVQAAHLGFSPMTREQLTNELQTLVDGGSLVAEGK